MLALLRGLKAEPCTDCGGRFPPECMDYDHLHNKKREIGRLKRDTGSSRRLLEEIAKCELVCANCHRIRTLARVLALVRSTP